MIGISKLYCDTVEPSDALRYNRQSKDLPSHLLQFSKDIKTGGGLELHPPLQPALHALLLALEKHRV